MRKIDKEVVTLINLAREFRFTMHVGGFLNTTNTYSHGWLVEFFLFCFFFFFPFFFFFLVTWLLASRLLPSEEVEREEDILGEEGKGSTEGW